MIKVRTRFAPSPTGIPHIGSIRTALFNYLHAKNTNGDFLLRIEDTDQNRSTKEHITDIKENLELLGLKWDEDYLQSHRLKIYAKHLEKLKKTGNIYEDEGAWRFKVDIQDQEIKWKDAVHGNVSFKSSVIEDFIILKSDGYPTYHFASVVDDHEMQISHVIRGDEWISSTPKHLMLYKALKFDPPIFCHTPFILGADHKKLSKRDGAKSVSEYVSEGYLPEAILNFLALLGWAPSPSVASGGGGKRDREMFTIEELIKEFTLDRLNKNSPIFNIKKLNWFNRKYIQELSESDLGKKLNENNITPKNFDDKKLISIIKLVKERMTTLKDFEKLSKIFFSKGDQLPPEKSKVEIAQKALKTISTWDTAVITKSLDEFASTNKIESSDLKNTFRLAVFADNTPPIYESLAVLTKEEVEKRIRDVLN